MRCVRIRLRHLGVTVVEQSRGRDVFLRSAYLGCQPSRMSLGSEGRMCESRNCATYVERANGVRFRLSVKPVFLHGMCHICHLKAASCLWFHRDPVAHEGERVPYTSRTWTLSAPKVPDASLRQKMTATCSIMPSQPIRNLDAQRRVGLPRAGSSHQHKY